MNRIYDRGDRIKPKNRRCAKRLFIASLILSCLISAVGLASAKAADSRQISLTLNQSIKGSVPASQAVEFNYTLTPKTALAPMPAGSTAESYTFKAAGTGETYIGTINFNAAGVYTYELRCVSSLERFRVDQRIYTIEVYVTNGQDSVSLVYISDEKKMPELSFEHTYIESSTGGGSVGGGSGGGGSLGGGSTGGGSAGGGSTGGGSTSGGSGGGGFDGDGSAHTENIGSGKEDTGFTDIDDLGEADKIPETNILESNTKETGEPIVGPKTGDFSNPPLWIALIIISNLLLILILLAYYKSNVRRRGQAS